jgi:hypothetical protein
MIDQHAGVRGDRNRSPAASVGVCPGKFRSRIRSRVEQVSTSSSPRNGDATRSGPGTGQGGTSSRTYACTSQGSPAPGTGTHAGTSQGGTTARTRGATCPGSGQDSTGTGSGPGGKTGTGSGGYANGARYGDDAGDPRIGEEESCGPICRKRFS